ncbi:MAG: histidine triad nucleotide-binding protein [Oligoflexia bacterium]|nr:histidine triad nucleotide-binding protein [Oligoflexia bacterium]
MGQCLFCKIVDGAIPAAKVFENETVLAFKDIQPQAKVHYLFIPKKHYSNLNEIKEGEMSVMASVYGAIAQVAKKEGFDSTGYRTVINTNGHGCQSVFHVHVHVLAGEQLGGKMTGV